MWRDLLIRSVPQRVVVFCSGCLFFASPTLHSSSSSYISDFHWRVLSPPNCRPDGMSGALSPPLGQSTWPAPTDQRWLQGWLPSGWFKGGPPAWAGLERPQTVSPWGCQDRNTYYSLLGSYLERSSFRSTWQPSLFIPEVLIRGEERGVTLLQTPCLQGTFGNMQKHFWVPQLWE